VAFCLKGSMKKSGNMWNLLSSTEDVSVVRRRSTICKHVYTRAKNEICMEWTMALHIKNLFKRQTIGNEVVAKEEIADVLK
jgi:hypothetical protein